MALKPKVGPAGAQSTMQAPVILNNMVSLPTLTSFTSYWKFTATKTGYVIFDVCLSLTSNMEQTAAAPTVGVSVVGASMRTALTFDEFGEASSRESKVYYVEKGKTYTVEAVPYSGLMNMVVRVSDYSTERTGPIPDLTFSSASVPYLQEPNLNHQDLQLPRGGGIDDPWQRDATGHFNVQKTLLGPASASQYNAIKCAWNLSRQVAGDAFYSIFWGAEPGPNYPYWNPGYAVCPTVPARGWGGSPFGNNGATIGYSYNGNGDSSFGLGYGDAEFYIDHLSHGYNFREAGESLKNEAIYWMQDQFGDPTKFGSGLYGTGYEYTFKTNKVAGNVVAFAVACDEWNDGGPTSHVYGDLSAKFFIALADPSGINGSGYSGDYTEANWRAANYPVPGGHTNLYWPGGLEASRAATAFYKAAYAGGYMEWVEVPADKLAAAKELEKTTGVGLWVALVPDGTAEENPPIPVGDALAAQNLADPVYQKNDQSLASRYTCEYPDYDIIDYPAYPDSTMLGIGGGPGDAERYFVGRS